MTGIPLANTAAAASGSTKALNSAAGVTFPSAIAPPIQTIRSSRSRTSGCRSSMSATFVSGAVGTSTTPGSIRSARKSAACWSTGCADGSGSSGPSRPLSPWTCAAVRSVAPQRRVGARRDRDVAASGDLERDERVAGRLVERLVAGDGRDADQLDLGRREREQDRDRVVVAGVAVDDDRRAHSSASTSSAVGSELCAPNARRCQRARDARAPQRFLALAALEQRDDEAGGERVAGAGAVDGLDRGRLGPGHLVPVLEQDGALGAEREADEPARARRAPRARAG